MARRKQDDVLAETTAAVKYLWRHRSKIPIPGLNKIDQIKVFGKTLHIDNTIPALIEDTFANLGYEQKDGTKPVIAAKRRTATGWHLVIHLPPGVKFGQIKDDRDFFADATNSWVELEWKHGKCHMNIQPGKLPELIKYEWDDAAYSKMYLPIPIGLSRTGPVVLDLPEAPHLLVAGPTGGGKTSLIESIIHSVWHRAAVIIIDLKGSDFTYLEDHCLVAITNEQAHEVLTRLYAEYRRRIQVFRQYRKRKIQHCPVDLPYIVVIIDELAELSKENFALFDSLVRLARATGMSIIAASQRTSTQVIKGDTRMNFLARICFATGNEADSRVVLGEDCGAAGQIPIIKGRAIYRFGLNITEVQTMYLSPARAEKMALLTPNTRRWDFEHTATEAEPEVKRLKPR